MNTDLDCFEHANRARSMHLLFQGVLAVMLIIGIDNLTSRYFLRRDLSQHGRYALSAETQARIKQIKPQEPVTITASWVPDDLSPWTQSLSPYLNNLLKEYAYAGSRGGEQRILLRFIDVYQDRLEIERLTGQYNITEPRFILIESRGRHRVLFGDDLATIENNTLTAFNGEQALTQALGEIIQAETKHLYFTRGHGEMQLDDFSLHRGLSELHSQLQWRNYAIHTVPITEVPAVPDSAHLLIIAGPRAPFQGEDVAKIQRYLQERAGRVMVFFDPGYPHGLEELCFDWGLRVEDMMVVETDLDAITATGDLRIRRFARHPITELLIAQQTPVLVSLAQPVRREPDAPQDSRLTVTYLLNSSQNSWAERAWRENGPLSYDPRTDQQGPIPLLAIAERKASPQLGLDVRAGCLTVLGSSDFIANRRLANIGNASLIHNLVRWHLDQQNLLSIPPQPIEAFQLTLSRRQQWRLGLFFLLMPGAIALLGIYVLWQRRR